MKNYQSRLNMSTVNMAFEPFVNGDTNTTLTHQSNS